MFTTLELTNIYKLSTVKNFHHHLDLVFVIVLATSLLVLLTVGLTKNPVSLLS